MNSPQKIPTTGTQRARAFQPLETRPCRTLLHLCAIALLGPVLPAISATVGTEPHEAPLPTLERITPDPTGTTNELSFTKLRLKDADEAQRMAKHLQFNPADATAWRLLGEYHFRRSEYGEAATNFTKGLQLTPNDSLCANNLAAALVMLGQLDEARKILESRIGLAPQNYSMRFNLACIAARQNRKSDAIRHLLDLEQTRWPALTLHLADPDLDSLRKDPPFIAIQQRIQRQPAGARLYEPLHEQPPVRPAAPAN